jgi:short-subunit dehydrogenase
MLSRKKYGNLALVAGASEGIGAAFSTYLAEAGMDLFLIARKKEPLEQFASSLAGKYNISVQTLSCDLSEPDATKYIKIALHDLQVDMLIYNAALSFIGPFENDTMEHCNRIATANMITSMNLVKIFGEEMVKKGRGAIILMSSMAGFQGSGYLSSYAATKAFTRVFAESLWYEWKEQGVDVIACCAGATSTKNYLETNPGKSGFFAPRVTTPEEVVEECFRHLGKRPSFIAGAGNKVASFLMQRVLPRKMAINIMGDNTRKIYKL